MKEKENNLNPKEKIKYSDSNIDFHKDVLEKVLNENPELKEAYLTNPKFNSIIQNLLINGINLKNIIYLIKSLVD